MYWSAKRRIVTEIATPTILPIILEVFGFQDPIRPKSLFLHSNLLLHLRNIQFTNF